MYPTTNALLQSGDYANALRQSTDSRTQAIATILLGMHEKGLALLDELDRDYETDYYRAFALWCLNRKNEAIKTLQPEDLHHQLLSEMIQRKVRVVCQARHDNCAGWDVSGTLKANPDFDVLTVGSYSNDELRVTGPFHINSIKEKLSWTPDFYLIHMAEYRIVPNSIEDLNCPLIFTSNDVKCDYQAIHALADICDAWVVLGSQSHSEITGMSKKPAYVYPKCFSVPLNQIYPSQPKTMDVFYSGNMFAHNLHDKSSFMVQLARRLHKYKTRFTEKKTSLSEYFKNLGSSKVVPTYIQQGQDSFSSRALEAIACRSVAIVPQNNVTALYFSPSEGLVQTCPAQAADQIKQILSNWDLHSQAVTRGYNKIISEFGHRTIIDHWFKWLALLSIDLRLKPPKRIPIPTRLTRYIESDSPLDLDGYYVACSDMTERIPNYLDSHFLTSARAFWLHREGKVEQAKTLCRNAAEKWPNFLPILFNAATLNQDDMRYAEPIYLRIIRDHNKLAIEKHNIILDVAQYTIIRNYNDQVLLWMQGKVNEEAPKRAIAGICALHLAHLYHSERRPESALLVQRAVELNPDCPLTKLLHYEITGDKEMLGRCCEQSGTLYLRYNSDPSLKAKFS